MMSSSLIPRIARSEKGALTVAYFTMEIAPKEGIPTFAGGLGILAGDLMKAAADLKVPAVCMTMCWQFGYLHQTLKQDGSQTYNQSMWKPEEHLTKLKEKVQVTIEGRSVTVGCWELILKGRSKGAVPVYFLDTNLPENSLEDRTMTQHLYGGDQAMRIKQELVLGIGGIRMLRALGHQDIGTYHMNEGHCAFLTLELLRERGFKDEEVKKSCAFTTHTPVKAGHDVFAYDLAHKIAGDNLPWHIRKIAGEDQLSMTQLAMTMSRYTCGVSQVHGGVARAMLGNPSIDAITNGVHHIDWASPEMQKLFDQYLPGWREDPSVFSKAITDIPDEALEDAHRKAKQTLIKYVKDASGISLDPDILTICSARRVVPYKRPELLYTNIDRLRQIGGGKLQIIHAGNAHPHDPFSQDVIRHMIEHSRELEGAVKIVYLPNYRPDLAKLLVSGADIWLNTPIRLMEASGTSGMKAALNGTINVSTLDGWWVEAYDRDPEAGWRIGPLASALDQEDTRKMDAEDLYTQLQYQVIDAYYNRERTRWLRRMKHSIALLSYFSAERAIGEYLEKAWRL